MFCKCAYVLNVQRRIVELLNIPILANVVQDFDRLMNKYQKENRQNKVSSCTEACDALARRFNYVP